MNGVYQEGQVLYEGMPISFLRSRMDHLEDYQFFTTEQGRWGAVIPIMENITLDFLTPCADPITSVNIIEEGGSNPDNLISEIESDEDYFFQVNAQVVDCNGEVSHPTGLVINSDQQEETLIFSGTASELLVAVCDNDFEVSTFSLEENSVGPSLDWNTELGDELELLVACNDFQNGFGFIQIREDMMIYDALEVRLETERTQLITQDESFWISFRGTTPDKYNAEEVNVFLNEESFGSEGYLITCETSELGCGITDFYVTHFEEEQGWLRLSFSGEVWMQTIQDPTAGYFPVKGVIQTRL